MVDMLAGVTKGYGGADMRVSYFSSETLFGYLKGRAGNSCG